MRHLSWTLPSENVIARTGSRRLDGIRIRQHPVPCSAGTGRRPGDCPACAARVAYSPRAGFTRPMASGNGTSSLAVHPRATGNSFGPGRIAAERTAGPVQWPDMDRVPCAIGRSRVVSPHEYYLNWKIICCSLRVRSVGMGGACGRIDRTSRLRRDTGRNCRRRVSASLLPKGQPGDCACAHWSRRQQGCH